MNNSGLVYVVDDEEMLRLAVDQALTLAGFTVRCFRRAEDALQSLSPDWAGVLITDLRMPGTDGLQLMTQVLALDEAIPVILISGHADIATAIQAIRDGAYDFVEKPFATEQLVDVVCRARDMRALILDNRHLRAELELQRPTVQLLGKSPAIRELNRKIAHIGRTDADVLVFGETGSGKELVAQSLHRFSRRSNKRYVAINCGALPENLIESELFGHVRGAFTGADKTQTGKLEYANGGTFLLDEIESMPMHMQVKMLRVLQERKIQRVGSNDDIDLDIRIVAASKSDLLQTSQQGQFREDLYYRLNVVALRIPPLRERKEDIPGLFQHFYDRVCERMSIESEYPSSALLSRLIDHDWPGNVRELQHAAERAAIGLSCDDELLNSDTPTDTRTSLGAAMDAYEKLTLERALLEHGGNLTRIYEALGISRKTLYDKMKKHRLSKDLRADAGRAAATNSPLL